MVRFGILGTAAIARSRLIPAMREAEGCFPDVVASRDAGRADAFARECGVPRSYGSYEALLRDPDVDAAFACAYEISGSAGRILVDRGGMVAWPGEEFSIRVLRDGSEAEEIAISPVNSYQLMLEAFAKSLKSGGRPPVSHAESIANLEAMDRIRDSFTSGQCPK